MTASENAPAAETAARSSMQSWVLVFVLTTIYTYAYLDRQVLSLLAKPITEDLHISVVQMSLLLGLAFAVFYAVLNLPAGFLVDRVDRRKLIGVAGVGWSLMTLACGLARNFWQLFAGRAGVGLAEAVIAPASFSIIRDGTSPAQRGRAFSFFAMAPYLGGGISLIGGGAIIGAARRGAFAGLPLIGGMQPWQIVLIIIGGIGIPLVLVLLALVRDPGRRGESGPPSTIGQALSYMGKRWKVYLALIAFVTLAAQLNFGTNQLMPLVIGRNWGLPPEKIGPTLGLVTLFCGPLGLLMGGFILDRLTATGRDIRLYGIVAASIGALGYVCAPLAPSLEATYACYGFALLFAGTFYAVGAATLSQITPSALMGKVTALYLLVVNIIGQTLGPTLIALAGERLFTGPRALGYGMSLVDTGVGLMSVVLLVVLLFVLRASRDELPSA